MSKTKDRRLTRVRSALLTRARESNATKVAREVDVTRPALLAFFVGLGRPSLAEQIAERAEALADGEDE